MLNSGKTNTEKGSRLRENKETLQLSEREETELQSGLGGVGVGGPIKDSKGTIRHLNEVHETDHCPVTMEVFRKCRLGC